MYPRAVVLGGLSGLARICVGVRGVPPGPARQNSGAAHSSREKRLQSVASNHTCPLTNYPQIGHQPLRRSQSLSIACHRLSFQNEAKNLATAPVASFGLTDARPYLPTARGPRKSPLWGNVSDLMSHSSSANRRVLCVTMPHRTTST